MTLTKSFNRPKLTATLNKAIVLSAAIAEGVDEFIVDINLNVTKDDNTTVTKTIVRVKLPITINGNTLQVDDIFYNFPGSAPEYAIGGNTPELAAGKKGNTVSLSEFLTMAGDTPENS